MLDKLNKLEVTLSEIETKGNSTLIMANARYQLSAIIQEIQNGSKPLEENNGKDS